MAIKVPEIDKRTAGRRRMITIITAALAVIASGISFALMLERVPNMHVIFYLVFGFFALLIVYLVLWTLSANKKRARLAIILRRCYLVFLSVGLAFFLTMQG